MTTTITSRKAPARTRKITVPAETGKTRKITKKTDTPTKTESVADYFKDDQKVLALLADPQQRDTAISQMADFAEKDHSVTVTEVSYGEALYNILKLSIEAQRAIVWAIADKNGVPRPEYPEGPKQRGRQPSGRKQLAEAQYGKWEDMITLQGKNKDTRGAMLVTYHVHNFKIKAGLMEERTTRSASGVPKRTLKKTFEALLGVLKNERETNLLTTLFERLGISAEALQEWKTASD